MTEAKKAKRKLSDIDFTKEGSHIALVSKDQGGPANGHDYALVMKSANFSEDFIQKASQVKVTMEITEFLRKFFYMYSEDAEVLARALGFTTAMQDYEAQDETEEEDYSYASYIESKLESFEIMKSLKDTKSVPEVLSKLKEDQYLSFLKDQEQLEKTFKKIDKQNSDNPKGKSENSTDASVEKSKNVEPSGSKSKKKETQMTNKTQVIEKEVEVVEKSVVVDLEKALGEQKEQLTKALATIEAFQVKEKEAIQKAKFSKVLAAVKVQDKAEVLFKALSLVEDEAEFEAVVKALADMQSVVEKSELFKETGVTDEVESPKESGVAKVLKAKFATK